MTEYTRKEISSITGVSSSSVQVWTDRGVIIPHIENPTGKGTTRLYDTENAIEILLIKEMQKYGIPLLKIKSILAHKKTSFIRAWQAANKAHGLNNFKLYLIIHNSDDESEIRCYALSILAKEIELKINMERQDNALVIDMTEIFKKTMD
ncbi:MAG: MerR family transcriptional regulator [Candidatus Hodarchaeota archaeon]